MYVWIHKYLEKCNWHLKTKKNIGQIWCFISYSLIFLSFALGSLYRPDFLNFFSIIDPYFCLFVILFFIVSLRFGLVSVILNCNPFTHT